MFQIILILIQTELDLMSEAGCLKKEWTQVKTETGSSWQYSLVPSGELLEKGICIDENYQKNFAPENEQTKVFCTVEYQKVRKVDAKDQTVSIDLILTLKWYDPNIRTNFESNEMKNKGMALRQEATEKIWTPDLHFWNSTTLKLKEEWAFLIESRIHPEMINKHGSNHSNTVVEMKYEIKTTVYCNFQFTLFPLDVQNCSITAGSGSKKAIFVLNDPVQNYHLPTTYHAVGLEMKITFFGKDNRFGNSTVGFNIAMTRLLRPYMMKYYIPCVAIVLVSEIGFVIPLTAIPGRVALLVTQFLTLINLFIYQMVRIFSLKWLVDYVTRFN